MFDQFFLANGARIFIETPLDHFSPFVLLQFFGACGEFNLIGVLQIERQLRGRWIASLRIDFEASQNDFLKPGREIRAHLSRRCRVAP